MRPLTVHGVMTPAPVTIDADAPLEVAAKRLERLGFRHLPVLRDNRLVGLIALEGGHCHRDPDPLVVAPGDPLDVVAREMARRKVSAAVVLDRDRVAGLFTTSDALRVLGGLLGDDAGPQVPEGWGRS